MELTNCAFGYWKITFKSDQPNWKLATCTCPIFYKRYICKHIVGIAMLKKLSGKECPLAAKTIPLGARRRAPGRPQHAPLAYARMTNFTSLAQIDDEAESEEVIEDSGAQEPEPLDSVQSSMQEENVPPSSSISEDSSSTSNMTPFPYTNSYTDYPNHFEPFFNNGADSNCANDAEFTVPKIPYPPLCREINRLSAINSNPDSFSEQSTSDFTFISNGNSTENSAPLVYANLETVNSVYLDKNG